jgi:mycothiol synthase
MQLRRLQRDDRDTVLSLCNASARYDAMTPDLFEEKTWGDPDFDPELALVAVDDEVIVGVAVGVLRPATRGGYVKLLAVEPARQRRGVGRALLEAVETRLAGRGAHSIRWLESAPNYLAPGIDTRYEAALAFAGAMGYRHVGDARNLRVDLTVALPARTLPGDVEVRRASTGDEAALGDFLDRHWPSWKAEADTALRNDPATLHLALRDGRVIGFAASDANNLGAGWFGPMGVAPEERRSGVGCVLLHRCLDDLRAQGHDVAVIAWVDNAPFYERCAGAVRWRTFARYEKVLHED